MSPVATKSRLHPTRIDLPEASREKIVERLNQSLASTLDLYTHTKQAHWNVKGKDFFQLHELFDEIAGELIGFVDLLAERATSLGGTARGTARSAVENSILTEYPTEITAGEDHLKALAERFAAYAGHIRKSIDQTDEWGDMSTADLYTEISRAADMRLWFLEAHLQES